MHTDVPRRIRRTDNQEIDRSPGQFSPGLLFAIGLTEELKMAHDSAKDVDSTDADHREIGRGLLEEEMGPSSSLAHLYRGEIHRIYLLLFSITLSAWIIRVVAFAGQPWPTSAAIGRIPGLAVTAVVAVFYLIVVVIAVRPRTWQAEDEFHSQAIGKHR